MIDYGTAPHHNACDSWTLAYMRIEFRKDHPHLRATSTRLGAYAATRGLVINDLGAHSLLWKHRFVNAYSDVMNTKRIQSIINRLVLRGTR